MESSHDRGGRDDGVQLGATTQGSGRQDASEGQGTVSSVRNSHWLRLPGRTSAPECQAAEAPPAGAPGTSAPSERGEAVYITVKGLCSFHLSSPEIPVCKF